MQRWLTVAMATSVALSPKNHKKHSKMKELNDFFTVNTLPETVRHATTKLNYP
ncbi:hypothetical protein ACI1AD_002303 [Cronobacter dublinensis]